MKERYVIGGIIVVSVAFFFFMLWLYESANHSSSSRITHSPEISGEDVVENNSVQERPFPVPSFAQVRNADTTSKLVAIEKQTDIQRIVEFLQDESPEVRIKVAYKLWKNGSEEAIAILRGMKDDPSPKVRNFVRVALAEPTNFDGGIK